MSKIIVELVDKNSGFADPVGRVNFSAAKVVQEVDNTKPIQQAIRSGVLMKTTKKRLEEWGDEREAYVNKHRSAKRAANESLLKSSVTLREQHTAVSALLATEKAAVKTLKEENGTLKLENKTLKEELAGLKTNDKANKK
jgi:hypothetical protein